MGAAYILDAILQNLQSIYLFVNDHNLTLPLERYTNNINKYKKTIKEYLSHPINHAIFQIEILEYPSLVCQLSSL